MNAVRDIINVGGTARRKKYFTEVDVNDENKEGGVKKKITVIDGLQEIKVNDEISIFVSESKTSIELLESSEKIIHLVLETLKKQSEFPWNRTHQGSNITTRFGLKESDAEKIATLIRETIKL